MHPEILTVLDNPETQSNMNWTPSLQEKLEDRFSLIKRKYNWTQGGGDNKLLMFRFFPDK